MNPAPKEGVLLYYKYVDLRLQQHEVHAWIQHLCTELHLRGRVRVARDGINVTVGGSHAALQSHIEAVTAHHALGGGIDFKLAALPSDCSEAAILEAGFDKLAVTLCKVRRLFVSTYTLSLPGCTNDIQMYVTRKCKELFRGKF